jgi:hypothetical protein
MGKFFQVVLFVLFVLSAFISFSSLPLFAAENSIGLTAGAGYIGHKMWRGSYTFKGEGAFTPFISYDILNTGLSVTFQGDLSDSCITNKDTPSWNDHWLNFALEYSHKFGIVTFGAGIWYCKAEQKEEDYTENYVSFTLEDIFLSPTLIYTHDYYFDSAAGTKGRDFYVQFGISHVFDLAADIASLKLGAIMGYSNRLSWRKKTDGISDINLSAKFTIKDGAAKYFAGFHYVIVPAKDYYYFNGVKDMNRFYSTIGASYSF